MQPYQLEDGSIHWGKVEFATNPVVTQTGYNVDRRTAPLALQGILEDFGTALAVGKKPERVYIQRTLFHHIYRTSMASRDGGFRILNRRRSRRTGKWEWTIDGVPVSFTAGKKPWYVWLGNGELK